MHGVRARYDLHRSSYLLYYLEYIEETANVVLLSNALIECGTMQTNRRFDVVVLSRLFGFLQARLKLAHFALPPSRGEHEVSFAQYQIACAFWYYLPSVKAQLL